MILTELLDDSNQNRKESRSKQEFGKTNGAGPPGKRGSDC